MFWSYKFSEIMARHLVFILITKHNQQCLVHKHNLIPLDDGDSIEGKLYQIPVFLLTFSQFFFCFLTFGNIYKGYQHFAQ